MSDTNRTPRPSAPTTTISEESSRATAADEQQNMRVRTDQDSMQPETDGKETQRADIQDAQDAQSEQSTQRAHRKEAPSTKDADASHAESGSSPAADHNGGDKPAPKETDSSPAPTPVPGAAPAHLPPSQRSPENSSTSFTKVPPDTTLPRPIPLKMLSSTQDASLSKKELAQKKKIPLTWHSRTEVGHVRDHNEDSYLVQPPLFAVADGMGGHEAGEVASSIAVSTISQLAPHTANASQLGAAVEKANEAVISAAEAGEGRVGMGTTCTAAIIVDNQLAIAHVGDSRAYLLHNGTLIRITHDHSFVEELVEKGEITADEARNHPNRSIITRALGSDRNMYADHFSLTVEEGDRVLLCTDGLSSMLTDALIEDIMVSSPHPKECVDDLIEAALRAGGLDNVTALVIDVANDGAQKKRRRHTAKNVTLWVVSVLAALAIVAGGVALYAQNSWFVVDEDGFVVVYRGLPGTIGPFSLNELENKTTIKTADLATSTAKRLQEGVQMSSRESVDQLLQSYRQQIDDDLRQKAEQSKGFSTSQSGVPTGTENARSSQGLSGDVTQENAALSGNTNTNGAPTHSGTQNPGEAGSVRGGESR